MNRERRKIMIVDDNIANLTIGRNLLKSHHEVYLASSAAQMFEILEKIKPDLILLDIEMPDMDGYEAIVKLKSLERFAGVPVMFLTAQKDEASELKGFDLGAVDYISKPFSPHLLLKRIEHQLLIVRQNETIQHHINNLSAMVGEKVGEVLTLQNAILSTVADLVEFRDQYTGSHIVRTQLYLKVLIEGVLDNTQYADRVSNWDIDYILQSAQLHDVGKIAIPDAILNKPARLTADEFEVMKTHVTIGIDAVNRMISNTNSHAFLQHTRNIIGAHHEKWDGTGYPCGLKGEEIPLEGRLMAVADVYDALVSWRPYKHALSHEDACKIIEAGAGKHFDPVLIDVFRRLKSKFAQIASESAPAERESPSVMTLTRDMEVGVPIIDAQHRELLDRLNAILSMGTKSACKEECRMTLDFLGEYILQHFSDEENLQKQSGYPKYEWHKSQHRFFVGEFQKLKEEFVSNGFSDDFSFKLKNSMINWIVRHIKSVDVEFGKYYQVRSNHLLDAAEVGGAVFANPEVPQDFYQLTIPARHTVARSCAMPPFSQKVI